MPIEEKKNSIKPKEQNVRLEGRKKLTITGVLNVDSFNEEYLIVSTELGILVVRGNNLNIQKLLLEGSELLVTGEIDMCEYVERESGKGGKRGFFSRMFK